MTSFSGMDVGEVERLADRLQAEADAVSGMVAVVNGAIAILADVWMGDDLDVFSTAWHTLHRPQASVVSASLGLCVTQLRHQIEQQRLASEGGVAGPFGLGSAGTVVRVGTPGSTSGSSHDKTWVLEMAHLAKSAYEKGDPPPGFTLTRTVRLADGFEAQIYSYLKPDGTVGYVVAFGGSDDVNDWIFNNATDFLGVGASQYKEAVDLARSFAQEHPGADLSFTGHSLGGGLASAASIATGSSAITFNSASPGYSDLYYAMHETYPSRLTYLERSDLSNQLHPDTTGISSFRTADDPLTSTESALIGRQSTLGDQLTLQLTHPQLNPLTAHGIDDLIASIRDDRSSWWH